ncbi:MAG: Holliday junction resolvase RuvX [Patescibacteria group bacterium]
MAQLLGIDYGKKRVGIALSDDAQKIALPHVILENDPTLFPRIIDIIRKRDIEGIVVGESRDLRGVPNPLMKEISSFAQELGEKARLPVHFEPEFLTSREARTMRVGTGPVDASAAAIILQSFIDKKENKGL